MKVKLNPCFTNSKIPRAVTTLAFIKQVQKCSNFGHMLKLLAIDVNINS